MSYLIGSTKRVPVSLEKQIEALVESTGAKLYDIDVAKEGGRTLFQVFITRQEGGVDVALCSQVSRLLSPLMDVQPPVSGDYTLEVSSPGIERKLRKPAHFQGAIGESVKVTLKDKTRLKGEIASADGEGFVLAGEGESIPYDAVAKAHVRYQW